MMKWRKETITYMWAEYFSEDGKWKAYDWDEQVESKQHYYNHKTKRMENKIVNRHVWGLENLETGEIVFTGKTLKSCKEYAENN